MTDWSNYVQYRCPLCQDNCINRVDHPATEANRCKQCYGVPSSEDTSEGTGALARPEAQATPRRGADEHPGTGGERQSPPAPARPTGSAPSWGDPEARTSPPNPEGEGNLTGDTPGNRRNDAHSDGRK
mgnify:CR=1 FL=1